MILMMIMMMSMMVMYYALHERERVLCRTELHLLPRLIKTGEDEAGVDEENDDVPLLMCRRAY